MGQFSATITEKKRLTPTILMVRMRLEQKLGFRPGQYVILKIPAGDELVERPFSIASSPYDQRHVDIIVRLVRGGIASTFLKDCRPANRISLTGPHGAFGIHKDAPLISLIASGSGIAPFRSLIADLLNRGVPMPDITLFFVVSQKEELFFQQELKPLDAAHKNFHFIPVVSNPHHLSYFRAANLDTKSEFYLCGGFHFVQDMAKLLTERGVEQNHIHFEEFK